MENRSNKPARPKNKEDIWNGIRIEPVWPKSKEDIRSEIKSKPVRSESKEFPEHPGKQRNIKRIVLWSCAAGLLIPVLLICHSYTVTEETARGQLATVRLPDNSTVTLNAESRISYQPCIWLFSRKVKLNGEANFDVKRGRRFSVQSGGNRVNVLGTTFNVYDRPGVYRVTCLTGQVEVHAGGEAVVLNSNMQAVFQKPKFIVSNDVTPATVTGWMQGWFVFSQTPLQEVIAEVERQYNIHVTPGYNPNLLYSGKFSKTEKPEEILDIIGTPFGITFGIE